MKVTGEEPCSHMNTWHVIIYSKGSGHENRFNEWETVPFTKAPLYVSLLISISYHNPMLFCAEGFSYWLRPARTTRCMSWGLVVSVPWLWFVFLRFQSRKVHFPCSRRNPIKSTGASRLIRNTPRKKHWNKVNLEQSVKFNRRDGKFPPFFFFKLTISRSN